VTVYAIAALKFTDRDAYSRYQAAFMDVFQRYSGTLLAVDEAPLVVEGKWDRGKGVVSAVPDEPVFREWAESVDYQWISGDRHAGAYTVVSLGQALPGND
jgi:uncharacterized protein (DUF1330 family)